METCIYITEHGLRYSPYESIEITKQESVEYGIERLDKILNNQDGSLAIEDISYERIEANECIRDGRRMFIGVSRTIRDLIDVPVERMTILEKENKVLREYNRILGEMNTEKAEKLFKKVQTIVKYERKATLWQRIKYVFTRKIK